MEKGFVDVGPPLVAHREPPVAGQPCQRSLRHPHLRGSPVSLLEAAQIDPAVRADHGKPIIVDALVRVVSTLQECLFVLEKAAQPGAEVEGQGKVTGTPSEELERLATELLALAAHLSYAKAREAVFSQRRTWIGSSPQAWHANRNAPAERSARSRS